MGRRRAGLRGILRNRTDPDGKEQRGKKWLGKDSTESEDLNFAEKDGTTFNRKTRDGAKRGGRKE